MAQLTKEVLDRLNNNPQSTDFNPDDHNVTMVTVEEQERIATGEPTPTVTTQQTPMATGQEIDLSNTQQTVQETPQPETTYTVEDAIFERAIQERFGVDLETFNQQVEAYQQNQIAQASAQLQADWGVDQTELTRRMQVLSNTFGIDHPEATSVEGVKRLWNRYQQSSTSIEKPSTTSSPTPQVPQYRFTMSQLRAMSDSDYASKAPEILLAFTENAVLMD